MTFSRQMRPWISIVEDEKMLRSMGGLFLIVNGWAPTLLELAAWLRWTSRREDPALDTAVQECMGGGAPAA